MEHSQESTIDSDTKIDVDRFDVRKFSRWMDEKKKLLVVIGFYHGARRSGGLATREAVDLLNVHDEHVEYVKINSFIHLVIEGKLKPWQAPEDRPLF